MFLFEDDFTVNRSMLHGVMYFTVGFYCGKQDIFQKIKDLIKADFNAAKVDKFESDILSDNSIAIDESLGYCVEPEGGESHDK